MELLKLSSRKIKFAFIGILSILIMGGNSPVYAVIYHFEEDFSSGPDEDWEFSAWFYPPFGDYESTNHTFTFDNELVSAGEPKGDVTNYAMKNDTTAFGAWSFDVFIPSNPLTDVFDNTFSIGWDLLKPASYWNEPGRADWPEFSLSGVGEGLNIGVWNKTKDPTSDRLYSLQTSSGLKFDQIQHLDVIRTDDSFQVYNDGDLIVETVFSSDFGPEINYVTMTAAQGSGVKFDNLKITTDAQGVLDSLIDTSQSITSVSNTPYESTDDSLFYAAGTGIVALTGTVSYWRLSKKKI